MKTERWAFSESELVNPKSCRADDELVAALPEFADALGNALGIIVYRNGQVSNRFEDGTIGVPDALKTLANEVETLAHNVDGEVEPTWCWADVETEDGRFVRFVQHGPQGAEP
jgi:hypothetical protein